MIDPRLVDCAVHERKRMRREAKIAQGYEKQVAKCGNCSNFIPTTYGAPGKRFTTAACGVGHFAVEAEGICDVWQGKNGDRLQ